MFAAGAAACGATDPGADAGPLPVATCSQPATLACGPDVPCVDHWPSDLAKFCPRNATLAASVSHAAQRCAGHDVVMAPAGVDTALVYLFAQDGALAAVVMMGNSGYQCLGGPTPLPFPGLCGANPSTDTPDCCAPAPDETVDCWAPDSGAGD